MGRSWNTVILEQHKNDNGPEIKGWIKMERNFQFRNCHKCEQRDRESEERVER